jgi:hypothetical protein
MTDQSTKETSLAKVAEQPAGTLSIFGGASNFDMAERIAKQLASSTLVPEAYRGNVGNCLIAMELAQRTNNSILAVTQNLNIIHGKPGWGSSYTIGAINSCGRFSPLKFKLSGEGDARKCVAYAKELATGEVIEGPEVTIAMAKAEGWFSRTGSKWKTMPELMLQYRAAAFFGRLHAPDVLMGMHTEDEVIDVAGTQVVRQVRPADVAGASPSLVVPDDEATDAEVVKTTEAQASGNAQAQPKTADAPAAKPATKVELF